jgi:[ribosomal protein S18]-alanine N-acetyltransferase
MNIEFCADPAELARLHAQAFDEPWSEADIATLMAGPGLFALAAGAGGEPTGFVLCRIAADEAEILTLATSPAHRRRGVATALVRRAAQVAAADGARVLFLEVAEDNAPALALYAQEDFQPVGRRAGYYARGAERADAVLLRRDLNSVATRPYA